MRRNALTALGVVVAVAALVALAPAPAWACTPGQSGTTLSATVDCSIHWEKTFSWTIEKSVTPETIDMFTGDSAQATYTITVTKSAGTEHAWIHGQVHVTNGGGVATEGLAISLELRYPPGANDPIIATGTVDVSGNPVLDPGETGHYGYTIDIPAAYVVAGRTFKVTANVTITNHSGHLGTPFGPNPSCTGTLPSCPTEINDSINVDDTNGGSWSFEDSGSVNYKKTFTCDADEGTKTNTATIRGTTQSDTATVTVNCYALTVTKDADTSFTRTYHWTIDKSASGVDSSGNPVTYGDGIPVGEGGNGQPAVILSTGQTFSIPYKVVVDLDGTTPYTDSDWAVSGSIAVYNPAPIAATINSVSDAISGIGYAPVDCGVTFPYSLAAAGTLNCDYSADLPGTTSRTNTATATLQNTPSGTTSFIGTASVVFSGDPTTEVDECVAVEDDFSSPDNPPVDLGEVCFGVDDLPVEFTYSLSVGPYQYPICNDLITNTVTFTTNDGEVTGDASWVVAVLVVPCPSTNQGCTLTPGYWKTHSDYGPAPYDDNWALLPGGSGEDTIFFHSTQTYYQVLWTAPKGGNAYYILAHAYIAAELNILNGAGAPQSVVDTLAAAKALFQAYSPSQFDDLKGKTATSVRGQFLGYATILDQYNNGLAPEGPPHCSESPATP